VVPLEQAVERCAISGNWGCMHAACGAVLRVSGSRPIDAEVCASCRPASQAVHDKTHRIDGEQVACVDGAARERDVKVELPVQGHAAAAQSTLGLSYDGGGVPMVSSWAVHPIISCATQVWTNPGMEAAIVFLEAREIKVLQPPQGSLYINHNIQLA